MLVQDWVHQLLLKARSGSSHAFLITGNVADYAGRDKKDPLYYTVSEVLAYALDILGPFAFVAEYDIGGGLKFQKEEMQERYARFREALDAPPGAAEQPTVIQPMAADPDDDHNTGETELEDGDPFPAVNPAKKAFDAQLVNNLPVQLRDVFLNLPEKKKQVVRDLPNAGARVQFLMSELAHGPKKAGNGEPIPEDKPTFELPQRSDHAWMFIRELLRTEASAIAAHLPEVKKDPKKGGVRLPAAVIVRYPELLLSGGLASQRNDFQQFVLGSLIGIAQDSAVSANGNVLILVTEQDSLLPDMLTAPSSGFATLEVPHPDETRRADFMAKLPARINALIPEEKRPGVESLKLPDDLSPQDLGRGPTAGIRLLDLEALGRDSVIRAVGDKKQPQITLDDIWELKRRYLEQQSAKQIRVKKPLSDFSWIGGHEEIKAYLAEVANHIRHGNSALVPKGILFVGPPGTGKSVLAQALAGLAGFSYAEIDLEFDPFVGMSARNRSRNRRLILSLAPVVVFEDEFESKHLPRGAAFHGDSGVSARMDAMEREFLADDARRGKVVWVAATNRPDQLEDAMIRPGRFDRIIPVLPPRSPESWVEVFRGVSRKLAATHPGTEWQVADEALLELVKNFPAETAQGHANEFCYRALHFAKNGALTIDALVAGVRDYKPRKNPDFKKQVDLALEYANSRELIPEAYRAKGLAIEEAGPAMPKPIGVAVVYPPPPELTGEGDGNPPGEGGKTN